MGYTHIDFEERCAIARLLQEGRSIRGIAATLDRSPPTISREIKRNRMSAGEYKAAKADEKAGAAVERLPPRPRRPVAGGRALAYGVGLIAAAGARAPCVGDGRPALSYESIYRFIAAQVKRTKGLRLAAFPAAEEGEAWAAFAQGAQFRLFIRERRPLSERPPEVAGRVEFGHWEADMMLFGARKQALLILHERALRVRVAPQFASALGGGHTSIVRDSRGATLTQALSRHREKE